MFFIIACSSGPESTVKKFYKAWVRGDQETVLSLVDPEDRQLAETGFKVVGAGLRGKLENFTTKIESNNGKNAIVVTSGTLNGKEFSGKAYLTNIDGKWYIDVP